MTLITRLPQKTLFLKLIIFLPLLLFSSRLSFPQSPGGVSSGLELWLKSDAGFTYNSATNAEWLDQSTNGLVLNANLVQGPDTDSAPIFGSNEINFNPGVVFDGIDTGLATAVDAADFGFSEWSIFSVQQGPEVTGASANPWHYTNNGSNNLAFYMNGGSTKGSTVTVGGTDVYRQASPEFDDGLPHIFAYISDVSDGSVYYDGLEAATISGQSALPADGAFGVGLDFDNNEAEDGDNHYSGEIGEIILFNQKLSSLDRQKVQSYLAIKYGLALDQTTPTDYLASNGTTAMWTATDNSGYTSGIFGIGRDDNSALNQKVSKSANEGSILTISVDSDFTSSNTDAGRTTSHSNDLQFIVLAHNGGSVGAQFTEIDGSTFNTRTSREWKVDKTANFTQNTNLKFEGFDESWTLIRDVDGDFSSGATVVGSLDANGEISNVSLTDGEYITLAKLEEIAPGGVITNLSLWIKADGQVFSDSGTTPAANSGTIAQWNDQGANGNHFIQSNAPDRPTYLSNSLNFNPQAQFDGSNAMDGLRTVGLPTGSEGRLMRAVATQTSAFVDNDVVFSHGAPTDGQAHVLVGSSNSNGLIYGSWGAVNDIASSNFWQLDTPHIIGGGFDGTSTSYVQADGFTLVTDNDGSPPTWNTVNDRMRIGADVNVIANEFWIGNIAEVIVYAADIPAIDQQKIDSYLALKYGISLNQTVATDYLASNGTTTMWTAADNTGYTSGIFGIGRDDASGLNQRVSKSVNEESILTLALNSDFIASNQDAARTTDHTNDLQFLMVAHNGGATTTQTTELDATTGFNLRISREWKADVTNFTQNVSLKFEGYDDSWSIIATADGDFSSGVTTVGALNTDGEFTTTTAIADGLTFTLARNQQGPGGVRTALNLWLRADQGTVGSSNVSQWKDQSPNGNNAVQATGANQPAIAQNAINFHPMFDFDGSDDIMDFDNNLGLDGNNAFTLFGIMQMPTEPAKTAIIATDGCGDGFAWYQENVGVTPGTIAVTQCGTSGALGNPVIAGEITLRTLTRANGGNHVFLKEGNNQVTGNALTFASNNMVLGETNGLYSDIHLSELIVFNSNLSVNDRDKVHSYLAIKYGTTLDQTTANDYVDSEGNAVWDASANPGYTSNIFGIGRDDSSGLDQKVSKSVNDNAIVTIALDNDFTAANNDAARTTNHANDLQFLMLAHNGEATTTQTTELDASSGFNTRIAREWKADVTNFTQNVSLKFKGYDDTWSIIATADGDFSSGVTTVGSLNANGEFTTTTAIADGITFTLAKLQVAPGGITSNLSLWLKADDGISTSTGEKVTAWEDASPNGYDVGQSNDDNRPDYKTNTDLMNFNPIVSFDRSTANQEDFLLRPNMDNNSYYDASGGSAVVVAKILDNTIPNYYFGQYAGAGTGNFAAFFSEGDNEISLDHGGAQYTAITSIPENQVTMTSAVSNGSQVNYKRQGQFLASGPKSSTTASAIQKPFTLGGNGSGANTGNGVFGGDMAEIIVYSDNLSATNLEKIESYLAIKYGITLDQTAPADYVSSDGTVVWDASGNTGYANDIFGIGRDDASGLDQRISKSVNSDAIVTIALDNSFTAANNDPGRTTNHTNDKQFLILANNGGTLSEQTTEINSGTHAARIGREWKVAKTTNYAQDINLRFTGYDETWELIKDDDGDFTMGTTSLGFLDANGEITGVSLADGDYLTLHTNTAAPTIVSFTPDLAGNGETVTITGTGLTGTTAVTFGGVAATSFTVVSGTEITAVVGTGTSGAIEVVNPQGTDTESGFIYKVAQYNFEGNTLDATDNDYDGTEINTLTYQTGAQGQAICFDNGPGYVKLPDNLIRSLPQFTISLRFKTTNTGAILGYQNSAPLANASNFIPILMLTDDGKLKGTLWTSASTSIQAISANPVNDGNWHQVDFTASTNTITIYLDGSVEASTTGASVDHLDMMLNQLGLARTTNYNNTPTGWEYFTGCIDDLVIIDRALTQQEIEDVTELPEPTITSFTPTDAGEEDTVVITGTNFDGATQVTFGGEDAASYIVDSSTQITATIDAGATGDVAVTTAGGTAIANGFTFLPDSFTVSETSLIINENAGTDTFTVVLDSQPSSDVVFDVSSDDTDEATIDLAQITFTSGNWDTPQTITVTGVDDGIDRDDAATITVSVNDAGSDNPFDALPDQTLAITLTDDDSAAFSLSETALTIDENGGTGTFTVVLETEPTSDVVFDVSSNDTDQATVDESQLTFTDTNWDTPRTITVTGIDDTVVSDDTATITVAINTGSSDDAFDGLANQEVAVTLTENDAEFTIDEISDTDVDENTTYTSATPTLSGDTPFGNLTYTLGGNDTTRFTINSATGVVSMVGRNFESPEDSDTDNSYEVSITATDEEGNSDSEAWTVTVNNVNESASFSIDAIADANVDENSAYTSATPNITGSPNGSVTYGLGGTDAGDFTINASTGVVSMVARDFENAQDDDTDNIYEVSITATDEDSNTDSEAWTVTVDDVTETMTFTIDVITDVDINENTPYSGITPNLSGDTPIGEVTFTLADVDANDFTIDPATGAVSMVAKDFENPTDSNTNSIYLASIIVTDEDGNTATQSWDVTVMDVTESANFTIDAIADVDLDENSAYTGVTPNLSGDTPIGEVTFTLADVDANDFTIDASTGVVSMVAKDFENPTDSNTNSIYLASIVATDEDGNTATQSWDVTVTDVNESASFTIDTIADEIIDEETPYVGPVPSVTGPPVGELTYSLGGADAAIFSIDNATGQVFMPLRSFENPDDVDDDNTYEVSITAIDEDDNSATEDWTVTLRDVVETANFTLNNIPDATVEENSSYVAPTPILSGDAPIGNVFFALGGADATSFVINATTGMVTMVARDFENPADNNSDNSYDMSITATDDDGNTANMSWSVTISDVDEGEPDADGDGVPDSEDAFPNDPNEDTDTDGDGIGDNADTDDDGDGTPDSEDAFPLDENEDTNTDGDGFGDNEDMDDDGDGTPDTEDAFPLDENEDTDTDGDGIGNNTDEDDDGDGLPDSEDPDSTNPDTDGDGIPDGEDADVDGDGVVDNGSDSDGDGINDENDTVDDTVDSDGDGVPDSEDAFPNDPNESVDADGDGIGANADADDTDGNIGEEQPVVSAEAFTPNGDGINDAWIIQGIENHPNSVVTVYNRYGHEVFRAVGYQNDWNGRYRTRSENLPSGSYYYVIDFRNGSAPVDGWLFINY